MNAHTSQFIESQLRQFSRLVGLGYDVRLSKGQAAELVAAVGTIQRQRDELLEALEAILPVYEEWTRQCGHDPSVGIDCTDDFMRIEAARAAIAKAKGVTP